MLLFLAALLLYSCSDGPSDYQKKAFIKFYGSYQTDIGLDVQVLASGGYALTGSMQPDSTSKMFLIITDEYGNQTTTSPNYYGGDHLSVGRSLLVLDDGFLLAGQIEDTLADGTRHTDIYLVRTDAEGNEIMHKNLGGNANEEAHHIIKRSTGGYVVAGKTENNDQDDLWIIMLDEDLQIISEFTGNNGTEDDEANYLYKIGSGYLVACTYNDGAHLGKDMMVLYLDEDCNLYDARALGTDLDDYARQIISFNGEYIIMGTSTDGSDYQIGLYSFSVEGNLLKAEIENEFATITEENIDYQGEGCVVSSNGSIAVVGKHISNDGTRMMLQFIGANGDAIVDENGDPVLLGEEPGTQVGYSIKRTLDGGLVIVGSYNLGVNTVIALVRTNANGDF